MHGISWTTLLLLILLLSCKENKADSSATNTKLIVNNNDSDSITYSNQVLDSILFCGDYSYMHGYFTIPYNGCIYNQETINKIGNIEIYLVPKEKINNNDIKNEENILNKLSISELKNKYKIYVFIIDKKFLSYNKNMEMQYYSKFPYKQIIYTYSNKWDKIQTLNVKNENDSLYEKIKEKLLPSDLINNNLDIEGHFHIKTTVISVESGEPIEVNFYLSFNKSEAVLSIGSNNGMEAYCEGAYKIDKNADILKLSYTGEGICTSDSDESSILIKKVNDIFYIKSKRFYENDWQVLEQN